MMFQLLSFLFHTFLISKVDQKHQVHHEYFDGETHFNYLTDNTYIYYYHVDVNLHVLICNNKGVNFMERTIKLRSAEITFSLWDLGGQREFLSMLPLVCNDAVALLFIFDLSRRSTLTR